MQTREEIWKFIIQDKPALPLIPDWIREMRSVSLADLLQDQKFHVETKELNSSYLQFMEEQITFEPRGPEWTEILRKRVMALKPFVNKRIVSVMVKNQNHQAFIKIDPEGKKVIYVEEDVML